MARLEGKLKKLLRKQNETKDMENEWRENIWTLDDYSRRSNIQLWIPTREKVIT